MSSQRASESVVKNHCEIMPSFDSSLDGRVTLCAVQIHAQSKKVPFIPIHQLESERSRLMLVITTVNAKVQPKSFAQSTRHEIQLTHTPGSPVPSHPYAHWTLRLGIR